MFNLQVIGEEGDTQLNLKWMNLDEKKNREDYCEGCKTKELRKKVKYLVKELLDTLEILSVVKNDSSEKIDESISVGKKYRLKNTYKSVYECYQQKLKILQLTIK